MTLRGGMSYEAQATAARKLRAMLFAIIVLGALTILAIRSTKPEPSPPTSVPSDACLRH
jgi:hypothetical protein